MMSLISNVVTYLDCHGTEFHQESIIMDSWFHAVNMINDCSIREYQCAITVNILHHLNFLSLPNVSRMGIH